MVERLRKLINLYPGQFWMMFVGMLIMTIGSSMIWPFLMVYVSGKLNLPLTTVASLMTINAVMTLISSFISGPIIDKVGRKWAMVVSLLLSAVVYIFMSQADTLLGFAILMGLQGAINPLYRVGADAMMADLISPEKRVEAYSLLRMSNNVGVAIGPAIGGFIATSSYTFAFFCAAAGMAVYGFLTLFLAKETLPGKAAGSMPVVEPVKERFGGYGR
ncbi:MAG: MFS transporter, partial [Anaerolineaceae bacterium]|nr:MFS transporter [Anaerolineaceae bacterium]